MNRDYEKSVDFSGNASAAITFAQGYFSSMSFEVTQVSQHRLQVQNTARWSNTKQNPLVGMKELTLTIQSSRATIEADFNAFRKLLTTIGIFCCVFDVVAIGAISIALWQTEPVAILITAAAVIPMPLLFPLVYRVQMRRMTAILEDFLDKMAAVAR